MCTVLLTRLPTRLNTFHPNCLPISNLYMNYCNAGIWNCPGLHHSLFGQAQSGLCRLSLSGAYQDQHLIRPVLFKAPRTVYHQLHRLTAKDYTAHVFPDRDSSTFWGAGQFRIQLPPLRASVNRAQMIFWQVALTLLGALTVYQLW